MNNTKIYINTSHLTHNYYSLCHHAKNATLGAVVKAGGYGCGLRGIAAYLYKSGCRLFFVATFDEGVKIRELFGDADIYVFEGIMDSQIDAYHENMLRPVINSLDMLNIASDSALPIALHIDTGMNRLGLNMQDLDILMQNHALIKSLDIQMIMSHFACADTPDHILNAQQKEKMQKIKQYFPIIPISFANSAGILYHSDSHYDIVRAGIGLYGGLPHQDLKNVVSLKGNILQIRTIQMGESVGYGADYIAHKPITAITVSGGYADGIPRSLLNSGYCAIYKNYKIPLIGRVSMDSTIFDVSNVPESMLKIGEEVEFFGDNYPIYAFAGNAKTISYEILTGLGKRSHYIYHK